MSTVVTPTRYALVVHGEDDPAGSPGTLISASDTEQGLDPLVRQWQDHAAKGDVAVWDKVQGWRKGRWAVTVRRADHEAVTAALPGFYALLLPGRGTADETSAYRRWGYNQGYQGHGGGWITRHGSSRPIGQGWKKTFRQDAERHPQQARVLHLGDRCRAVDIVGGVAR